MCRGDVGAQGRGEEFVLVREVVVEDAVGHGGGARDGADGQTGRALFGEQALGGGDEMVAQGVVGAAQRRCLSRGHG